MALQRKPSEALLTCLETFARWLPLWRGPELIILTSEHQFAKTVEIPSRNRFRFFFILYYYKMFLLNYNVLQKRLRRKKEERQIT